MEPDDIEQKHENKLESAMDSVWTEFEDPQPEPTVEEIAQSAIESTFAQTITQDLQILSGAEEDLTDNPLSLTGEQRRETYAERLRLMEARDSDRISRAREERLRVNENVTPAGLVLPVDNEDYINLAKAIHTGDQATQQEFKKKGYLEVRPPNPDDAKVIFPTEIS
jgi:hypothetical protein